MEMQPATDAAASTLSHTRKGQSRLKNLEDQRRRREEEAELRRQERQDDLDEVLSDLGIPMYVPTPQFMPLVSATNNAKHACR